MTRSLVLLAEFVLNLIAADGLELSTTQLSESSSFSLTVNVLSMTS